MNEGTLLKWGVNWCKLVFNEGTIEFTVITHSGCWAKITDPRGVRRANHFVICFVTKTLLDNGRVTRVDVSWMSKTS